jgi:molecular chaperone HscA
MAKIPINLKSGTTEKDSAEIIVGIDLGTTNSLVAYIEEGRPVIIKGKDVDTLVPSLLHLKPDGSFEVGTTAKSFLVDDPANTIYSVKRLMGKSYADLEQIAHMLSYKIIDEDADELVKIQMGERFYSPIELSAEILRALKSRAEAALGQPIGKAVITVPAYFNDSQRQATRDAGKLAGLDVLRIINEPTAASLAYGLDKLGDDDKTIAVYDLGGGTFDISILHLHGGIFEVVATHGDTFLGGDDMDRAIFEYWLDEVEGLKEWTEATKGNLQRLRLTAEKAKKALSESPVFEDVMGDFQLKIDRLTFERSIVDIIAKTIHSCRQAMADAGVVKDKIDEVVLVGGATRVPAVKQAVKEFFGVHVNDAIDPDEVVALGAAIQADILAGNQRDILLLDVTPLSLGIETVGGLMDIIVPRNSKIPHSAGRKYTTSIDGQANLKISVYQGERDLVEHNRKLGEFILSGIPPMAAGLPKIEIQFLIDANGILQVKAKEERSGVEQSIEIKSQYGISEEDMAKMLIESIENAQEDMETRALKEARNEANYILKASDRFIAQNKEVLSEHQVETIQSLALELSEAAQQTDKDKIHAAMEKMNAYTSPLAHEALDRHIAHSIKGQNVNDGEK